MEKQVLKWTESLYKCRDYFFFLHWRKKNLVTAQYVGDPGWGHSSASFCFQPLSLSVLSSSGGLHTYENHSSIDASGLFLICFPCLHPSPLSMFSFSLLLFTCSISHTDFCCLFLELAPNLLVPLFFLNSSSMYIPVYCQGEDTFFFFLTATHIFLSPLQEPTLYCVSFDKLLL